MSVFLLLATAGAAVPAPNPVLAEPVEAQAPVPAQAGVGASGPPFDKLRTNGEDPCGDDPNCVSTNALRIDEHDVIVTANRVSQPTREVGQAVTVLTRGDIERRQTVVLSDLLATTPGVTFNRNGGVGGLTGVSIRGAETAQTLVVIDGVRVNDPSSTSGGFDFANLLSSSVERVEILRGPNSVPWGSQAIGGVVNIITQRPAGFEARAQAEGGSYGTAFASAGVSGTSGRFSGALNGGYLRTDGVSAAANGTERDGYRQEGGSGRLSIDLAEGIGIDLSAYYAHSRVQLDGSPPPTYVFGDDPEYSKTQEVYGYAGLHANRGGFGNRVAFTIADINRDNYASPASPDSSYRFRGRTERYEYQGDFRPLDAVRLVLGAERENARYYDGSLRAKTGISSGYGEAIVKPVESLTLTGGVRYDRHDQFGGHLTFGGDGALALGSGTTIRASYGEGFKAPTLYQLYSGYGTRSLRPEQARNVDGGIEQALLGGRVRASATYFNRRTRDQIDFRSCATALVTDPNSICFDRRYGTYDNITRTTASGVELALAVQPVAGFTVQGEYSFIDARNRSAGANYGHDLARRPRQTASLSADYRFPFGLQLGGTVLVVGDSYDDLANTVRLDGYELTSLRAEYPIGPRVAIYGRVENLFDEHYQTAAGYGTLGRAAYGGVRLRFR